MRISDWSSDVCSSDLDATGTDAVELISSGKVDLVVNSPRGRGARADGAHIRSAAGVAGIPCLTTAAAAVAAASGLADSAALEPRVRTLPDFHAGRSPRLAPQPDAPPPNRPAPRTTSVRHSPPTTPVPHTNKKQ